MSSPASEAGETFSRNAVLAMVMAGVLSFAALAVLSAYAPDLRTGGDSGADALSKSAVGFAGAVELLRDLGAPVVISRNKLGPSHGNILLVLTPQAGGKIEDVRRLAFAGPTLIVLPKWELAADRRNSDWVTRTRPIEAQALDKALVRSLTGGAIQRRKDAASVTLVRAADHTRLDPVKIDNLQSISGSALQPVLVDESGAVVMAKTPGHDLFILADPDLLNTYGLRELAGAKAAVAIINAARPSARAAIFFDVTLNGFERSRSLWKLALEPPFAAATLCALVAVLLMGLHAAARFGATAPEDRAFGLGKRALADNQAALIRMAKREPRMAPAYVALVRDGVARAVGADQVADPAALDALLDRLGAKRTTLSIVALMQEARQTADAASLMRLARRIHQWKLEMTLERH